MKFIFLILFLFLLILIYRHMEQFNQNKKGTCKCVDYYKKNGNYYIKRTKKQNEMLNVIIKQKKVHTSVLNIENVKKFLKNSLQEMNLIMILLLGVNHTQFHHTIVILII